MRSPKSLLLLALFVVLIPVALSAQDNPPPKCCPRAPEPITTPTEGTPVQPPVQGELVVPRAVLHRQGITPAEFIDRLSDGILPGRRITIVTFSENVIDLADESARPAAAADDEGLIAVRETRVFRQPRARFTPQQLDQLNLLWITDGEIYLKVTFVDSASPVDLLSIQRP